MRSVLLGEAREDRLRGGDRVVVDREVAVLDVDGVGHELTAHVALLPSSKNGALGR